ncbi:MAG TPA: efflux transporter outer membrane subunit [Steroidobacteraceae bacterium]|nr:efflux transporter outer membrane subunit [Steroidobacteraceae bacterium]
MSAHSLHSLHSRCRTGAAVAAVAAGTLVLTACTVGPNFVRPSPPLSAHWPAAALAPAAEPAPHVPSPAAGGITAEGQPETIPPLSRVTEGGADLASWWMRFNDPQLTSLIERALRANLDLRVAILRTQEALEQRSIDTGGSYPNFSANASYQLENISESTPEGSLLTAVPKFSIPGVGHVSIPNPYSQYQLGASASWELDLFGRLRRTSEAANASAQVSIEDQRSVRVSLLEQVAQSYLALRGAQARRAVALQDVQTIQQLLQLTQQRRAAGLTTEIDVRNALAQLSQTRATLPALDLSISQSIHALGNLLGEQPEALRAELARSAPIPPVPPRIPIGLPAQLVRRRPDIREAEANLHAATAQIGVAIADLFPRLTLSGAGGLQSDTAANLLNWKSLFGNVGPQLDIPVFDRGAWHTVPLYRLRAREAALTYQSTVLSALHQVEDAMAAYNADQQQRQWLTDTVTQNGIALQLARDRYASGLTDFLDVLDALRTLQQNQMSLLASTTAVSTDLVALYRALGGGWGAPAAVSAARAERPVSFR